MVGRLRSARAALYFSVWTLLAYRFKRGAGAPGLILYLLTLTFAAMDWTMSIEPRWFSTIYGILVTISAILSALALTSLWIGHRARA